MGAFELQSGGVNNPPVITSDGGGDTAMRNVAENSTAVTTVTATDADPGTTFTYSITDGADQDKFTIDSSSGVLAFVSPPNYETPTDVGTNNVYDVTVQVSDGELTDTQTIAVTVTDINDGDYNLNGTVDAADYVMWRKAEGSMVTPFSGADGSGNGAVDEADYDIWRANFGNSLPPPASGSTAPVESVAVGSDEATIAEPVTGTAQRLSSPADSNVRIATPRSSRPRSSRRDLPLVAGLHDEALVAWLASRGDEPRHDLSASDFANVRREPVSRDALGQLDNALDIVFASLGS